jgi:predicted DNA-binding protein (UPF0251 family)
MNRETTRGERHPRAKLTEHEVRAMRAYDLDQHSLRQIGANHGVHWTTVRSVVNNETWKHVK